MAERKTKIFVDSDGTWYRVNHGTGVVRWKLRLFRIARFKGIDGSPILIRSSRVTSTIEDV